MCKKALKEKYDGRRKRGIEILVLFFYVHAKCAAAAAARIKSNTNEIDSKESFSSLA